MTYHRQIEVTPTRSDWVNVIVGQLDRSFGLSPEHQDGCIGLVERILSRLDIPDRATPATLPVPITWEADARVYSQQLAASRDVPFPSTKTDDAPAVSILAWSEWLIQLITSAYPDLRPEENLWLASVFADVLAFIEVPSRVPLSIPTEVLIISARIDGLPVR